MAVLLCLEHHLDVLWGYPDETRLSYTWNYVSHETGPRLTDKECAQWTKHACNEQTCMANVQIKNNLEQTCKTNVHVNKCHV